MGQFDNFSGGFEVIGAMYDHGSEGLKWHTVQGTYGIASSPDGQKVYMQIEPRTNDPVAPIVGRLWLRTDL